jgi:hypothetical protein
VIGTGGVAPSATKGLEFDAVLVVDPDRILAEGPQGAADLYVALTRATQRLGVLHRQPLPGALRACEHFEVLEHSEVLTCRQAPPVRS